MKKQLVLFVLVSLALFACTTHRIPDAGTSIPSAALQALTTNGKVQVIDARTEGEYKEGHIPGATQIDVLQEASFLEQIKLLDTNKAYVVYCRSGRRSKRAMELMLQNGFKNVSDLEGGLQAWEGTIEK